jgi:hypothetical protein
MVAGTGAYQITGGQASFALTVAAVLPWRDRWAQMEREAPRIGGPLTGPLSREAIAGAAWQLKEFFVTCYHLKDDLIHDSPGGLGRQAIEQAVTNSAALALLADVANTIKHGILTRQTRTGVAPVFGPVKGTSRSAVDDWDLGLEIVHGPTTVDGVRLALDAVAAWRAALLGWGLI